MRASLAPRAVAVYAVAVKKSSISRTKSSGGSRTTARTPARRSWMSFSGHPSVEELLAEQGTGPITDVSVLRGEFWPEDESIEDFLEALHEWRGHKRTDPAA